MSTAEDSDEKKSRFLEQLKDIDMPLIFFHKENLWNYSGRELEVYESETKNYEPRQKVMLKGMDLGDVKHYNFEDLSIYTDDKDGEFAFGRRGYGRFLRGKIWEGSSFKEVVIKTWDVAQPFGRREKWLPSRLQNEIMLLTYEHKKLREDLPKLIGYSIDKRLCVIYDLDSNLTLFEGLAKDNINWECRMNIALQVAHLMQYFHGLEPPLTIGSIDSNNILLDKKNDMKLCEFGFTMRNTKPPHADYTSLKLAFYHAGTNSSITKDLYKLVDEGKTGLESDIFSFGHLLMELINRKGPYDILDKDTNFVDKSLTSNAKVGCTITKLGLRCLDSYPSQRPNANEIVEVLQDVMKEELREESSSKRQKI